MTWRSASTTIAIPDVGSYLATFHERVPDITATGQLRGRQ